MRAERDHEPSSLMRISLQLPLTFARCLVVNPSYIYLISVHIVDLGFINQQIWRFQDDELLVENSHRTSISKSEGPRGMRRQGHVTFPTFAIPLWFISHFDRVGRLFLVGASVWAESKPADWVVELEGKFSHALGWKDHLWRSISNWKCWRPDSSFRNWSPHSMAL